MIKKFQAFLRPLGFLSKIEFCIIIIKNSKFHNQAIEVYEAVNNLDEEQRNIAMFWDCNPNQSNNFGHLMFNSQQISPAGHWIHITCQVVDQENLSNLEASYALAKVGITLADSSS